MRFAISLTMEVDLESNCWVFVRQSLKKLKVADESVYFYRSKPVLSVSSSIAVSPSTFDIKGRKTCNETGQGNVQFATKWCVFSFSFFGGFFAVVVFEFRFTILKLNDFFSILIRYCCFLAFIISFSINVCASYTDRAGKMKDKVGR